MVEEARRLAEEKAALEKQKVSCCRSLCISSVKVEAEAEAARARLEAESLQKQRAAEIESLQSSLLEQQREQERLVRDERLRLEAQRKEQEEQHRALYFAEKAL